MSTTSSGPLGQRDQNDNNHTVDQVARDKSRNVDDNRIRRYLSLGIPVLTVAILGVYVLVWWVSNANPALQASPADQQVIGQVTSIPPSIWQRVGAGGRSNPWYPVGGQPSLDGPNGHPEFFYVGGEFCEFCAPERWAILNALSRFGSFSHLSQLRSYDDQLATFSFYRSTYTSPYVDFVPVEHIGNTKDILGQFVTLQPFRSNQQQLFNRYASTAYLPTGQGFPFVDLNNQYLVGGGIDPGALQNAAREPLSWQQIAHALQTPSSPVAQHILGTANFLTAAICLVTNQQPGSVCRVSVIQQIDSALRTPSSALVHDALRVAQRMHVGPARSANASCALHLCVASGIAFTVEKPRAGTPRRVPRLSASLTPLQLRGSPPPPAPARRGGSRSRCGRHAQSRPTATPGCPRGAFGLPLVFCQRHLMCQITRAADYASPCGSRSGRRSPARASSF
jgi:hypothetical protein